jgi:hypothetical protein
MSTETNKAVVRSWLEAVDTGEVSVVEQFLDPGYVDHNPPPFRAWPPASKEPARPTSGGSPPSLTSITRSRIRTPKATP